MKLYNMVVGLFVVGLVAACSAASASETSGKTETALTPTWTDYVFTASTTAPYSADLGSATDSICGLTALSAQFNQSTPVSTGVNLFVSGGDWQVVATVNGAVRCFAASDFTTTPSSLTVATVSTSGSGYQSLGHTASTSDCLLGEVSGKMLNLADSASVVNVLGYWNLHTIGGIVGQGNCLTYSGFKSLVASTIGAGTTHTSCGTNCKNYALTDPTTAACFITGVDGDMSGDTGSNSMTLLNGATQSLQVTGTATMITNIACLPY